MDDDNGQVRPRRPPPAKPSTRLPGTPFWTTTMDKCALAPRPPPHAPRPSQAWLGNAFPTRGERGRVRGGGRARCLDATPSLLTGAAPVQHVSPDTLFPLVLGVAAAQQRVERLQVRSLLRPRLLPGRRIRRGLSLALSRSLFVCVCVCVPLPLPPPPPLSPPPPPTPSHCATNPPPPPLLLPPGSLHHTTWGAKLSAVARVRMADPPLARRPGGAELGIDAGQCGR